MPQNLFSRLIKYRSTEFKTNRENFLTESFAVVLENDDYFARLLIQKAVKALNLEHVICDESLRYSVETQVTLPSRKRPDMCISFTGSKEEIYFENKWDRSEGRSQTETYSNEVRKRLIYLTKPGADPPQAQIPHWTWRTVNKILTDSIKEREQNACEIPWISREFLNWMEEVNMVYKFDGFDCADKIHFARSMTLVRKTIECLDRFKERADENKDWKSLGLKWKTQYPNPEKDFWCVYVLLDDRGEVTVNFSIDFQKKPKICLDIESNPDRVTQRKQIADKICEAKTNNPSLSGFFNKEPDDWTLIAAYEDLDSFREKEDILFERLHKWWLNGVEVIVKSGIIQKIKEVL